MLRRFDKMTTKELGFNIKAIDIARFAGPLLMLLIAWVILPATDPSLPEFIKYYMTAVCVTSFLALTFVVHKMKAILEKRTDK